MPKEYRNKTAPLKVLHKAHQLFKNENHGRAGAWGRTKYKDEIASKVITDTPSEVIGKAKQNVQRRMKETL